MKLSKKIIILILVVISPLLIFLKKEPLQELPITLYIITFDIAGVRDGDNYFIRDSIAYLGSITISSNKSISYSEDLYNKNLDYKSVVAYIDAAVNKNDPCLLTTYHSWRPFTTRKDAIIEKGPSLVYSDGKVYKYYGGWTKTVETYFPTQQFFKCIYEQGHGYVISENIGSEYERNGWHRERKPYELVTSLLIAHSPFLIEGYDGKYYSVPKEIKKHVEEWRKAHPEAK